MLTETAFRRTDWRGTEGKEYDRSRVVIATKAAHVPNKGRTFDNSPEFLKQSVEDALKRLQTDYIDIFISTFRMKAHQK